MTAIGQVSFGTGVLAFTPAGSNPTPIVCAVLQDVTLKLSQAIKKLYGQNKYPVAVAEAEGDVSGTAKMGAFYGSFVKQALAGSSIATGQLLAGINETAVIPTTPYQITVANGATFSADLSVWDLTSSKPLTRVASAPATGQYAVNTSTGVYTFAAADVGHTVSFFYSYTSTGGQTVSLTNQLMGAANTFTLAMFNQYNGQQSGLKLWACVIPGLDFAMKNNDFQMENITFEGYEDSLGRIIDIYTAE